MEMESAVGIQLPAIDDAVGGAVLAADGYCLAFEVDVPIAGAGIGAIGYDNGAGGQNTCRRLR
jgi:hypothetical protein